MLLNIGKLQRSAMWRKAAVIATANKNVLRWCFLCSIKTSVKTVFKDIPGVGRRYKKYKDKNGIPNRKEPWSFIALSKNYEEETQSWE